MFGEDKKVVSLMAREIGYGEGFEDVRPQLEALKDIQKKSLMLLVACDRIYGFFENRGGTANGPCLVKLVRDLAVELGITPPEPPLNLRGGKGSYEDVSKCEARAYYDELVGMGVMEYVGELGAKNVFCTIWECINEMVGNEESTLEEALRS